MSLLEALVLPAGREMDVTIGYYVMDLHGPPEIYPNYSTDISDAWQVVEKFYSMGLNKYSNGKEWRAYLVADIDGKNADGLGVADTAPLAICRAALIIAASRKELE